LISAADVRAALAVLVSRAHVCAAYVRALHAQGFFLNVQNLNLANLVRGSAAIRVEV
jgi:hypothetical protein